MLTDSGNYDKLCILLSRVTLFTPHLACSCSPVFLSSRFTTIQTPDYEERADSLCELHIAGGSATHRMKHYDCPGWKWKGDCMGLYEKLYGLFVSCLMRFRNTKLYRDTGTIPSPIFVESIFAFQKSSWQQAIRGKVHRGFLAWPCPKTLFRHSETAHLPKLGAGLQVPVTTVDLSIPIQASCEKMLQTTPSEPSCVLQWCKRSL